MRLRRDERGQASVEFVALAPLVVVIALACWQVVVAAQAAWCAGTAAQGAARAHALGRDPLAAARAALPDGLRERVRVVTKDTGEVRVAIAIPAVVGGARLGTVGARSAFSGQRP